MFKDPVFDGDYESTIIFIKKCTETMENIKYERILEYHSKQ